MDRCPFLSEIFYVSNFPSGQKIVPAICEIVTIMSARYCPRILVPAPVAIRNCRSHNGHEIPQKGISYFISGSFPGERQKYRGHIDYGIPLDRKYQTLIYIDRFYRGNLKLLEVNLYYDSHRKSQAIGGRLVIEIDGKESIIDPFWSWFEGNVLGDVIDPFIRKEILREVLPRISSRPMILLNI